MENQHFFYASKGYLKQIFPDEIILLQTTDNHTEFFTDSGKKHLIRISLDDALRQLPEGLFFRINRSEAVAISWIEKFTAEYIQTRTKSVYTLYFTKRYYAIARKQIHILQSSTKRRREKDVYKTLDD